MMNDQEDYAAVVKLLALKRHEVPPPGYFEHFSGRVMSRIEALEAAKSEPWWRRFLPPLTWRSGVAGANLMTMAGIAILGACAVHITISGQDEETVGWAPLPLPPSVAASRGLGRGNLGWYTSSRRLPTTRSTNGPTAPAAGLLESLDAQTLPVDFVFPSASK